MSGHSKWATIKHKKAATDAKRKSLLRPGRLTGSEQRLAEIVVLPILLGILRRGVRQIQHSFAGLFFSQERNSDVQLSLKQTGL